MAEGVGNLWKLVSDLTPIFLSSVHNWESTSLCFFLPFAPREANREIITFHCSSPPLSSQCASATISEINALERNFVIY